MTRAPVSASFDAFPASFFANPSRRPAPCPAEFTDSLSLGGDERANAVIGHRPECNRMPLAGLAPELYQRIVGRSCDAVRAGAK
ncbi:MAG: hypothetical protein P4L82_07755 [Ancalomicrobiaceae bacterium]|nr:hypothetical protein [Ancalomicrobiaceae bacterium]